MQHYSKDNPQKEQEEERYTIMDNEITGLKMFAIVMTFFIVGLMAGYVINEITEMKDYTTACNEQCDTYMREYCQCITPWIKEVPRLFELNMSWGDYDDG